MILQLIHRQHHISIDLLSLQLQIIIMIQFRSSDLNIAVATPPYNDHNAKELLWQRARAFISS
jgi:hypothetical protein